MILLVKIGSCCGGQAVHTSFDGGVGRGLFCVGYWGTESANTVVAALPLLPPAEATLALVHTSEFSIVCSQPIVRLDLCSYTNSDVCTCFLQAWPVQH